ncbi:MAG: uncharacterized protein A8A55_0700 [Amphiamblys sp. WSBS2006]|nr:MAG: uncharacterized protein A8A55_0700 [Amphiamblys sp. WSBS2006]
MGGTVYYKIKVGDEEYGEGEFWIDDWMDLEELKWRAAMESGNQIYFKTQDIYIKIKGEEHNKCRGRRSVSKHVCSCDCAEKLRKKLKKQEEDSDSDPWALGKSNLIVIARSRNPRDGPK